MQNDIERPCKYDPEIGRKRSKGWFFNRVGVDIFVFNTIKWVKPHMKDVLDTRRLIASIVR